MSRKHWSATDEHCRYINTGCCHQKPRYIFITVRDHNKGVKLMRHCHCFCRICDQISRYQRILHTDVSHCNTVTDCDCREHDRCSTCHGNSHLYCICNFIQVHMSRNDFVIRTYDSDKRSLQFFFCKTKRIEQ